MVKHANLQFRGLFFTPGCRGAKKLPSRQKSFGLASTFGRKPVGGRVRGGKRFIIPESLGMAFCTNSRLVVRTPFSVTNDIPPRGESKLIV
jgi:hypothetical protein